MTVSTSWSKQTVHSPLFPAEGSSEAVRVGEVGGLRGELGAVTGGKARKHGVILARRRHGRMETDSFWSSCCYRKGTPGLTQHYYCVFLKELILCLLLHAFFFFYKPTLI